MRTSPLIRLRIGFGILAGVILMATAGYRLSGWSWLDSAYMVVLTVSTVGYREVHEMTPALEVFTILVIIVGVSTVGYILGAFAQMMAEGEINRALGRRRVTREIEQLSDHVILCGFGRMGEILTQELQRQKKPFVVVERDIDRIAEATKLRYLALSDDATEEETLLLAGIARAKTLVTTLPSDADNVFLTLTARNLNRDVKIIARGNLQSTEKKLLQAGADQVVLPATAGAMRMAAMITRPAAVELIEVVAGRQIAEVEVDEIVLPADCALVGKTVRDSQLRSHHGLLIVAFRRTGQRLEFNPGGDAIFETGASVIVMGSPADIDRFRADYRL